MDVKEILAPGGLIEHSFPAFEERPEQMQMACAVRKALLEYLIPAIALACGREDKVLISTFTITLQEQLVGKDIPLLAGCLPCEFGAVLAKGRGNYLCKRRLKFVLRKQRGLFDTFGSQLAAISDWAMRTDDGSLSDVPFMPRGRIWDAVRSEHGNCRGRKCRYFRDCFYWRARRSLEDADIIVANHALVFNDLLLKEEGGAVLPEYRYVIIDEAHNIERVAEEHFGIDVSDNRVTFMLDSLYSRRTRKGLLAYMSAERAIDIVVRLHAEAKIFFKQVREWYERTKDETNGRCYKNFADDNISGHLKDLRSELGKLAKNTEDIDERFELGRFVDRCGSLVQELDDFLIQDQSDHVYWIEVDIEGKPAVRLRSAPVNVGPDVKRYLFDKYDSVILTSATLSSGS
ncbi:MAG: ATP-dependent DNA helicase, partial [Planctomycetota bacterium]